MEVEFLGYSLSLTWCLVVPVLTTVILYIAYDSWCTSYWRRRGVVHEPARSLIGNVASFAQGFPKVFEVLSAKHGKVYGMYNFKVPVLVVGDPEMLKHVLVKNFSQFHNRIYFPQNNKELADGLSALDDERWRDVRNLLTPTFSASKMRQMSPLVNDSADTLVANIATEQEKKGYIECNDLFGSFVMDTIGSCAFGLKLDSQANPNDPFVENAKHTKRSLKFNINGVIVMLGGMFPLLGRFLAYLGIGLFMPTDVVGFFRDVTMKAVALRKDASSDSKGRIDFLQLMVDAQDANVVDKQMDDGRDIHADIELHHDVEFHSKKLNKKVQLTDNELIAQALTFFTAGYETTTTLLGFLFYLLSTNPEIQEKLIAEVDEITPSRDSVGYTSIAAMPYLDQVVSETLRIYPPSVFMNRVCNETFTYEGLTVERGTEILIPMYTVHHDEDYWPYPDKFDPDRFTKAEKAKRHPFAWLPFGAGPHNCIGMRFALMEAKMAIVRVLQKYRFDTCPQTEIPPKLGTQGFLTPPNGITLKALPRTDVVD